MTSSRSPAAMGVAEPEGAPTEIEVEPAGAVFVPG
jgi:hypothetical protein